jgi:two-component system response regulator
MPAKLVFMLEDDHDDRQLTERIISELHFAIELRYFSNSGELFLALSAEKPSLILIDYNIVPENGVEVMKEIKSTPAFRSIPIVILSDTGMSRYRDEAYAAGAASFITKPWQMEKTREKIKTFFGYWFEVVEG